MLRFQVQMNSVVSEVFAFKTCCNLKIYDANLEILITNLGQQPVSVPSHFDLESEGVSERISTLMPQGEQRLEPGEVKAFYCQMDEGRWRRARTLVFTDSAGNRYPVRKISENLAASGNP